MRCQQQVGLRQRLARALHDRVDRAGRKLATKELAHKLGGVAAGDAVSDREGGDGRLQAGAEGAAGNLGRQLGAGLGGERQGSAAGAGGAR